MTDDKKLEAVVVNALSSGQEQTVVSPDEKSAMAAFQKLTSIMCGMADIMRATNERMSELARQVTMLEKVTPAQVRDINATIRNRAAALCVKYHAAGQERAAASAIRREIRLTHGVQSMRELPRVEYSVVKDRINLWDDYKTMKTIQAKGESNER